MMMTRLSISSTNGVPCGKYPGHAYIIRANGSVGQNGMFPLCVASVGA